MRRPTKELADAVGSDSRAARGSSVKAESVERDLPLPDRGSAAKVKREFDAPESKSQAWKDLPQGGPYEPDGQAPPSPLSDKGAALVQAATADSEVVLAPDLPSTVQTERRRRSSSASNATLAALMAGSSQRISRAREAADAARAHKADLSKLSLRGSTSKSGNLPTDASGDAQRGENPSARRHSSMADLRRGNAPGGLGDSVLGKRGGSSQRRSTLTTSARGNGKRDAQTDPSRTEGAESHGGSEDRGSSAEAEGDAESSTLTRSDRMATRRRSMML